jgi:hypothetical protein
MSALATPDLAAPNTLRAYLDRGFDAIGGWLFKPAVDVTLLVGALQDAAGVRGPVGEIGVWQGRYLALLSFLAGPADAVVGIDPFVHVPDRAQQIATLRDNLRRYAAHPDRVVLLKRRSDELQPADLLAAAGAPFTFVSIDGDHTMTGCLHDLRLVAPLLAPRGVVAVDDIGNLSCPGVIEATIRYGLSADAVLAPFAVVANKLFMARREHCAWYRDAILAAARAGDLGEAGTALANYDAHMRALGIPVQLLGEDILAG